MGQRPRVTIDWLRKGRRVEDIKILRDLIDDSSDWKMSTANLSESLFEKNFDLKSIYNESLERAVINEFLGQSAVTESVRINKNDLIPEGDNLLSQVESLLPTNLDSREKHLLSYVFSRMLLDDTPSDTAWPIIPIGLDSLSATLLTINMIARLIGMNPRWLLPFWSSKTIEFKTEILRIILDFVKCKDSSDKKGIVSRLRDCREIVQTLDDEIEELDDIDDDIELDGIVKECIYCLETFLRKESMISRQDPLSIKIEKWRAIFKGLESELSNARKELSKIRKGRDTKEKELEIETAEKKLLMLQNKIRQSNRVLEDEIQNLRTHDNQITEWTNFTLNPDGVVASKHEYLMKLIRPDLNVLTYAPLVKMCSSLSKSDRPGRPAASDLVQELGLKKRMAHYSLLRLRFLMNERYILSPRKLGLNYRFIITKKQKPGVLSEGLIERLNLNSLDEYSGCTVHLEPTMTLGPPEFQLPKDSIQLTPNSELVSMRLDLFDSKERKWNLDTAYKNDPLKESTIRRRTSKWLYRTADSSSQNLYHLTPTELDILGPLSVFRGLRHSRKWIFEQLGLNALTARRYVKNLVKQDVFRLLYLPTLEYCGLPVGMMVGGHFKSSNSRTMFINWMISRLPFARVFVDDSTQVVAYLRLPTDAITTVRGILDSDSFVSATKQWFVSGISSYRTYLLSVFHRLSSQDVEWMDPWN